MCACVCVSIFPKCILAIILVIKAGFQTLLKVPILQVEACINSHSLCIHSVMAPKLPPADGCHLWTPAEVICSKNRMEMCMENFQNILNMLAQ